MTQLTNPEFKVITANIYPTNGVGAITATDLRTQMDNLPDSVPFKTTGATAAPTANDDGVGTAGNGSFETGDLWFDETADIAYACLDKTTAAAVWLVITSVGVNAQDEGSTTVANATTMDFVGAGVVVTDTAGVATVSIPGGGSGITTQEEGVEVDAAAVTLNFVGAGVTATDAGANVTTVTVLGGIATEEEGVSVDTTATTLNFVGAGVTATDAGSGQTDITIPSNDMVQDEELVSYVLVNADLDGNVVKRISNAAALTVTVNTGLTGTEPCTFIQTGAGQITFDGTATISSEGGALKSAAQYAMMTLIPDADTADLYYLGGSITT